MTENKPEVAPIDSMGYKVFLTIVLAGLFVFSFGSCVALQVYQTGHFWHQPSATKAIK